MPYLSFLKIISNCNAKYANYNSELRSQLMLITTENAATENTACLRVRRTKKYEDKICSINQRAYFGGWNIWTGLPQTY